MGRGEEAEAPVHTDPCGSPTLLALSIQPIGAPLQHHFLNSKLYSFRKILGFIGFRRLALHLSENVGIKAESCRGFGLRRVATLLPSPSSEDKHE